MNAKQRRRSIRYWRYYIESIEPNWRVGIERCDWLVKNFGRKGRGRRYTWSGWNPTYYQFHDEKDYLAFLLRWGTE